MVSGGTIVLTSNTKETDPYYIGYSTQFMGYTGGLHFAIM